MKLLAQMEAIENRTLNMLQLVATTRQCTPSSLILPLASPCLLSLTCADFDLAPKEKPGYFGLDVI